MSAAITTRDVYLSLSKASAQIMIEVEMSIPWCLFTT